MLVAIGACSSAGGPVGASTVDGGRAVPGRDGGGPTSACGAPCAPGNLCTSSGKCVSPVTAVGAGNFHTCALHRDGTVSCWGLGAVIGPGLPALTSPVRIPLPGRARALAVGVSAACAVLESGGASCWGDLGQGPEEAKPVVTEEGAPLAGITGIAGGSVAFCASGQAGVHCWGENKASELARPASMSFPPRTAVMVLPGSRPVMAASVAIVVHDGVDQLCGWGNNDSGLVPGVRGIVERPTCEPQPTPRILQLTAGDGHVCARRGGTSFSCWGSNAGGQLGNGDDTMMDVPLPGTMQTLPVELQSVAAGAYHTCALGKDASVWCWGSNQQGECGRPSSSPVFSPAQLPTFRAVGLASGAGAQHTCALLEDGDVACWGSDIDGQLGSGATREDDSRFSATPVAVRW
jgi:alpha-tubulin suppressor-like RCC1 family protein